MSVEEIMLMSAIKPKDAPASEMVNLHFSFGAAVANFAINNRVPNCILYDAGESMGQLTALYIRDLFKEVSNTDIVIEKFRSNLPQYSMLNLLNNFLDEPIYNGKRHFFGHSVHDERALFLGAGSKMMGVLGGARQNSDLEIPVNAAFYPAFASCFTYKKMTRSDSRDVIRNQLGEAAALKNLDPFFHEWGGQHASEYWQPPISTPA